MTLYITSGIPSSGKSTWAAAVKDYLKAEVVNMDSIRERLTGNASDQSKNAAVAKVAEIEARDAMSRKVNVVWDATSRTPKARRNLIAMGREFGAKIVAVHFDIPLDVALTRNAGRERKVPEDVIARFHSELVPPEHSEGFDEIIVQYPAHPNWVPGLL